MGRAPELESKWLGHSHTPLCNILRAIGASVWRKKTVQMSYVQMYARPGLNTACPVSPLTLGRE